ncbi:semaphorin-4B-like [Melanotaenia boesemani]|uniref:semaphorin-4B-like n=1 Tax=Melanotaenia boesemani TaxID=1250792 RepID=UPI001C03C378|nr:semaphorin-4B-like [Melanotaenia boesemani]
MASSVLLLFLSLFLSSAGSLIPPRTSFLLNSTERPLVHFSLPDVHNTTTLLLSNDGSTLFVGARDAILSLDVNQQDVIRLKKKVQWSPTEDDINSCQTKGKNPTTDCPNFVHVLQPLNSTHLYACGSYAYSPHNAYIDVESFSILHQNGAKGHCPFSPFQRSTAITIDGELFTATTTDFKGVQPQISRFLSKDHRPDVKLELSSNLLEEPTFVSSSQDPAEGKLYFFFNEVGKEFNYLVKLRISRVAQVCKSDTGGQRILQRKWTSFAKAPVLCQSPKQLLFNIVQDVFTLQPPEGSDAEETLFYGVFTSQWSRSPESAVCVFKLKDIRAVFTSTYKTLDTKTNQWKLLLQKYSHLGKCGLADSPDSDLMLVKTNFLTRDGVKSDNGPILVTSEQQYSRVTVMRTQAANGKYYTVLFLLTESGFLHKVALFDQGARVIEEIQVFTQPQLIKNIIFSSSKGVVYVGTSEGVTAVPVAQCLIYRSCSQCVLARDPLCGWSRTRKICSGLDGNHEDMIQNLENSNVEDECQEENRATEDREVRVPLNEVVRLQCVKPSNLATLTWTSSRFTSLQEELFLQSADGSLSFLATSNTFGSYSCEAEEGGVREVVVRYDVQQTATPRSMKPSFTQGKDEMFEDIATEEPTPAGGQTEDYDEERRIITQKEDPGLKHDFTEESEGHLTPSEAGRTLTKTESSNGGLGLQGGSNLDVTSTSRKESHSLLEPPKQRSYHSELVVVSFLLAACIFLLLLGSLHMWRQKKSGHKSDRLVGPEAGSKTITSMEFCSLSSPEEAGSELKDVQA